MVDFLIRNRDHWSVGASQDIKKTWSDDEIVKFDRAKQKGDIVEGFEDGKLSEHAHANGAFKIVRCPEILHDPVRRVYEKPDINAIVHKRRRWKLEIPEKVGSEVDITVTKQQFFDMLVDKRG